MAYCAHVKRHNITLSDPVSDMVRRQVKSGRYKDFSAALQDAAWNYFFGPANPYQDYGVTAEEVEGAARRELESIAKDRQAGKLEPWKPAT